MAWVSLQERHIAKAFQRALFTLPADERAAVLERAYGSASTVDIDNAGALQGELRSRLIKVGTPGYVAEVPLGFADAYSYVLEMDGIPTYPTLADGVSPVCPFEEPAENLAAQLVARGIHAAELIPIRNTVACVDAYVRAFTDAGIVVMGGTEHNTPDRIPIEVACTDGPVSDYARQAFWEATCVVAAHQHLVASGEPGYVDATGARTGDDPDARRAELVALGAALITTRGEVVNHLVSELISVANTFGADPEYSRAGGGNASVKLDGVLHIKPSGVPLATLTAEDLVGLRLDVLLEALHSDEPVEGDPVMAAAAKALVNAPGGRRPSVEILFHALIPDALVLHTHPLVANALTCNTDAEALVARLFGDDAVFVPYTDPGVPLAREVEARRTAYTARTGRPAPGITFLGNHGIIVSGNSELELTERAERLTATIAAAIDADAGGHRPSPGDDAARTALINVIAPTLRGLLGTPDRLAVVTSDSSDWVRAASLTPAGQAVLDRRPADPRPDRLRRVVPAGAGRHRGRGSRHGSGGRPTSRSTASSRSSPSSPASSPSALAPTWPRHRRRWPPSPTPSAWRATPVASAPSAPSTRPSAASSRTGRRRATASRSQHRPTPDG